MTATGTRGDERMHVLIHDYGGHAFIVQLARALARRGHRVTLLYNASNPTTPKGGLARRGDDPDELLIEGIALPRPVDKRAFFDRWRLEHLYGRRLAQRIAHLKPDVVICANTPLDAVRALDRACRAQGIPWVFWLQDLIGEATDRVLRARLPGIGGWIGAHYKRVEAGLLARSAAVVGITEDFRAPALAAGVASARYTTVPNWAPLDEVRLRPKDNLWAQAQGLDRRFVFLYSGTLGFKHNPGLLLALARAFADDPDTLVVVNSQGAPADWLRAQAESAGLANLRVNPFQPYEDMPDVLGSADVLVSILEPDAGVYSVPSKVLSYHCAGRALLLAVPAENLAARIVIEERSGRVADPHDEAAFLAAARALRHDHAERLAMAGRARAYAERTFDIEAIAGRFEALLVKAGQSPFLD